MSSILGKKIKVSVFGQSHSAALGAVIDGLPSGMEISMESIEAFLKRRAGGNVLSTARAETDKPIITSGITAGKTNGAPLCVIFENSDTRSADYEKLKSIPRPSHADYPAYVKYNGSNDVAGGGHFSGRLTLPLCFAGALCIQILEKMDIVIGAHIYSIADVQDTPLDMVKIDSQALCNLSKSAFPVIDEAKGKSMQDRILRAAGAGDSVGGIIECAVLGLPVGLGEPMFDGIENRLSAAIFGIPAIKGIEFGNGFAAATLHGSQNNDAYYYDNGVVKTKTNNHGGVLGGLTTGMPLIFRVAVKPTPSIAKPQQSVNLSTGKDTELVIEGRHDPCIVHRAVPVIEAVAAAALLDIMMEDRGKF